VNEQIRWDPMHGAPYRIQSYAYAAWEMHGRRGVVLIDGSPRRPYCSSYVLDCGLCPAGEVARGRHAFPVQWIHYVTPLDRVWNDREEWNVREG